MTSKEPENETEKLVFWKGKLKGSGNFEIDDEYLNKTIINNLGQ